jgi:predicted Fe-Mo cluster-binding NifX family protein
MKVGIPVWGDKISPVFDTATQLMIVDTGSGHPERINVSLEGDDLRKRCARMKELGVETLICSAISNPFRRGLRAANIEVIQGISGPKEEILQAYLQGNLYQEAFRLPGCPRGKWGAEVSPRSEGGPCRKVKSSPGKGRGGRRKRRASPEHPPKKEA